MIEQTVKKADRIILGIDPGTIVMGYGILGVYGKKPGMIAMGLIELSKIEDHYMRLARIYERVKMLVEQYCPDEVAIEAPFFGKNVQSMQSVFFPLMRSKRQNPAIRDCLWGRHRRLMNCGQIT